MTGLDTALVGFAALLLLIAVRMPVWLAMFAVGAAGYVQLNGWNPFIQYLKTMPYQTFSVYTLSVIPLFILMGAFAEKSGLSRDLFRAVAAFVGHRRGGLGVSLVAACTGFGAICGSSVATTATFGRAVLPELRRAGYDGGRATGLIAVGGTLGILVPPSVILVIYAIATEQNIVKLFKAALLPGLLAALFYAVVVMLLARRHAAEMPSSERVGWPERIAALGGIWPAVLVAVIVVGGIYGGVFTPTEGAAVGCAAMLLVGLARRRLSPADVYASLLQTAETSAMIFAILLGAEVFNSFLALSQLPASAAEWIGALGWSPLFVVALLLAIYLVLGAVMDEMAMVLLTLPIFFPIVAALDLGMPTDDAAIWFGILVLCVVGIGLTAPPLGLNVFVIAMIAGNVPLPRIYRGVLPYLAADFVKLGLVFAFPALSLWLVYALE